MINNIKKSIRMKFSLLFIGILCFSCISSFIIVYLFSFEIIRSTILDFGQNYTDDQIKEISLLMIITLTLCMIIGSILMYAVTRVISKPIQYMSKSTKEVSKGNFDVYMDYDSEDEIGVLVNNFNLMAEELRNMEYLRKDFISNVAHEFKTPIASIRGFAQMIGNKNISNYKREEYINIIVEESERLSHLASNMLRISRLDNQKIPNKKVEFNLDEQIRKTVLLLENKWSKKNIDFKIDLEKTKFKGDEELIQQIWINVIDNAIKFSNEYGLISIELKNYVNSIYIQISDNGIGISEESKKRIFEKFYQEDLSRAKEGNGLGLSIVKKIVEMCNGEIEIKSALKKGTSVIITLPSESI